MPKARLVGCTSPATPERRSALRTTARPHFCAAFEGRGRRGRPLVIYRGTGFTPQDHRISSSCALKASRLEQPVKAIGEVVAIYRRRRWLVELKRGRSKPPTGRLHPHPL